MPKTKTSGDIQKCYNIMVTGKVQDTGFRMLIEDIARLHDLKGYAFNDIDGSVKMVCCGEVSVIDEFLDELRFRGVQKGAIIDDIEKEEITQRIFLPQRFLRLYTDELADIGRKLDKGNDFLGEIAKNTSELTRSTSDVLKNTSALPEIKSVFESFVMEQRDFNKEIREHNMEQREHNKHLEKILEKLAEKA
ncbi:hydrogenase maturation factor [Candidatus Methanoperedens nitroreducens]|uniref:acylphosphatase n=1 Tax=Candidatus Methanoperedens nitratireducens TaxID=1392998 RepID=A0A062V601_9EURY|nr:acylphosphatase [Candidatus Methanoperedens nitroreducens]KCZ71229.1 hydrogenase maturation factor [Candidatus Methanoperedens nitroreducens]MDJ1421389.1 acylphosphatase [Candidatus Methanoperedens sp.]